MHYDLDEAALMQSNLRHPAVSAVLYLSEASPLAAALHGPTLVTDQRPGKPATTGHFFFFRGKYFLDKPFTAPFFSDVVRIEGKSFADVSRRRSSRCYPWPWFDRRCKYPQSRLPVCHAASRDADVRFLGRGAHSLSISRFSQPSK